MYTPKMSREEVIRQGGKITEKRSIIVLEENWIRGNFYANEEKSGLPNDLADYNRGGKNPITSGNGEMLSHLVTVTEPGLKPLRYSDPNFSYKVAEELYEFLMNTKLSLSRNERPQAERYLHQMSPVVPRFLPSMYVGDPAAIAANQFIPVSSYREPAGNIEEKSDNRNWMLHSRVTGANDVYTFAVTSKKAISPTSALKDKWLVIQSTMIDWVNEAGNPALASTKKK